MGEIEMKETELDSLISDDEEEVWHREPENKSSGGVCDKWHLPWQVVYAAFSASIGSMAIGTAISFTSPLLPQLKAGHSIHLSVGQESWVASLVPAVAIFGGLIGGFITDYAGRQLTLVLSTVPFAAGWLAITLASDASLLYVGRSLTGLSSGILLVVIPIYIAEISPADRRGILLSFHALWLHIGTLWSYVIGAFVSWRWLATINIGLCLLMLISLMFVPETPRWLKLRGRHTEAKISLCWLRKNGSGIEEELGEIENSINRSNCDDMAKLSDFKARSLYLPLLLTLALMFFQIFAGIDVIWFYTVSVFQTAGNELNPYVQTIIVGLVGVFGSVASTLFMDSYGRRPMLIASGVVMTVCMLVLGIYFKLLVHRTFWSWLPLLCLIVYLLGFDFAWGPIPNAMVGELLPGRARGVASSLTVAWAWFLIFLVTKGFVNMRETIHEYGAFWFFSAVSFGGILFVFLVLPETKGKSLEQIELIFQ